MRSRLRSAGICSQPALSVLRSSSDGSDRRYTSADRSGFDSSLSSSSRVTRESLLRVFFFIALPMDIECPGIRKLTWSSKGLRIRLDLLTSRAVDRLFAHAQLR